MTLRRGIDQMRDEQDQRAVSRSNEKKGPGTTYFKWKDAETKIMRFLSDGDSIYFTWIHNFVPCADGKNRTFICSTEGEIERPCELCAAGVKRNEVGYGVALEREEIKVAGKPTIYQDCVQDDGEGNDIPVVGIVSQAWNNFWVYVDGFYQKYGSLQVLDLDILRKGADMTTNYVVIPNTPKDLDDLSAYDEFIPDVPAMLAHMSSEEYYDQHLRGIKPVRENTQSSSREDEDGPSAYEALKQRVSR